MPHYLFFTVCKKYERAGTVYPDVVYGVDVVGSKARGRIVYGNVGCLRGRADCRLRGEARNKHGPKIPIRPWQPQRGQRTGTRAATYRSICSTLINHPPHSSQAIMSSPPSQSTSRSNLDSIFNSALQAYKKKTGKDIASHPLATELQSCDSPNAILAVLRRQVPSLDRSKNNDKRMAKCLVPIVNVVYAFSATLGEGVGLVIITILSLRRFFTLTAASKVFSPAKIIFSGIGVLLLVGHLSYHLVAHIDLYIL